MMHDWSLVSLLMEWAEGRVTIALKNSSSTEVFLVAEGLVDLTITKREDWGESISINEVVGPTALSNGNCSIGVEIQSGDKIEIEARSISLPENI